MTLTVVCLIGTMAAMHPLLAAAKSLCAATGKLSFGADVAYVYNPIEYAFDPYRQFVTRYGSPPKQVLFLGMNPGPFGMAQTGVPFGDVAMVRDWLQVTGRVTAPDRLHPKRPVQGFACTRSEVSGTRFWGLFRARFGTAERFFSDHFVTNYCPLVFMEETGRNRTPDKLPVPERQALFAACDQHLVAVAAVLRPQWVIGVGRFAAARAAVVTGARVVRVLHPSPASPAANKDWAGQVTAQLVSAGVWQPKAG